MKYIKKLKELVGIDKDNDKEYFNEIVNDLGLSYKKISDNVVSLSKNGHEIFIKLGRSSYFVKPSYHGTFYTEEKNIKDIKKYLIEYDFKHIPNI